jgi:hypothetical protein
MKFAEGCAYILRYLIPFWVVVVVLIYILLKGCS